MLSPESNCVVQSSIIFKSLRTVDLPLIKPYCLLLKYEFSNKKCIIWSLHVIAAAAAAAAAVDDDDNENDAGNWR